MGGALGAAAAAPPRLDPLAVGSRGQPLPARLRAVTFLYAPTDGSRAPKQSGMCRDRVATPCTELLK